jgi:hypothetical protein
MPNPSTVIALVEDEQHDYLKVGGVLYSWIRLKYLTDATFPAILPDTFI